MNNAVVQICALCWLFLPLNLGKFVPIHDMKAVGIEVKIQSFFTSVLNGGGGHLHVPADLYR
jgi:hypothetical protein